MRSRLLVLYSLLLSIAMANTSNAMAQDAVVTFYSHGSMLTTSSPGSKHGIYYGRIFDGDKFLVSFKEGLVLKNNRFVVLNLSPGPHTFSASLNKHPSKDTALPIILESGKKYFIRAQLESKGIGIIEFDKGRLDQMSCEVAHQETLKATPLHKIPNLTGTTILGQSIPVCP